MTTDLNRDPDFDWLIMLQPTGLVVEKTVMRDLGLLPERQTQVQSADVATLVNLNTDQPALPDAWAFFEKVLGWEAQYVAGSPGGPTLPSELTCSLPEHDTVLTPHWAVRELGEGPHPYQLLVRFEDAGIDPDQRAVLGGWEATPHQRFERLLRETGVHAGLLVSDHEIRMIYAPKGETSGWINFKIRDLTSVPGRELLAGLKLILGRPALFTDRTERRLPSLLAKSREAQASVSTALSGQVLGALHELLRGLDAADPEMVRELAKDHPAQLYEGLLTLLMRLVFILYAEDRDLLPSLTDAQARDLYDGNYSVRGLYGKLVDDAALNPDTMDERRGAWGRLLSLFRLIHAGHVSGFVQARGGKLFDPDIFLFLEGRRTVADKPRVMTVSDGCIYRILEGLMTIAGERSQTRERLSYRTLDVEQIGSVYETVMGFTVEVTSGTVLAIKAGKNNRTPVFVDLDALLKLKAKERIKYLKEEANRTQLSAKQAQAIEKAANRDELAAAFDPIIDERGSPMKRMASLGSPVLQPTDERRRTGSHYTPRSLTEPIVRYALEPAFERLGYNAKPDQILDLKVCDPAMGSGAFLVEATRAIAARLVKSWQAWPELKPKIPPDEDDDLHARRLVAQRCIYGVDKNPLAADLAKLSLWLATLARDHEFSFLDHALKSGDSLVGLTLSQIAACHWDETKQGLPLYRQLVREKAEKAMKARSEIQNAPDDTMRSIQEARHRSLEADLIPIRQTGDAVIAAFFANDKAKPREKARASVESYISGLLPRWDLVQQGAQSLRQGEHPISPFHWELEFPEVFARENGGFDAMIGNPPFAGKNTIIKGNAKNYLPWLQTVHEGAHGNSDIVAHFFLRAFELLRKDGVCGLIATNTIGQGDTRSTGLTKILSGGGAITRATRRLKWPGEAAVVVSVVHFAKGTVASPILDGKQVRRISAYLVEGDLDTSPAALAANSKKSCTGCYIYGNGFLFDDTDKSGATTPLADLEKLLQLNPSIKEVIFPYIGGEEINNDPQHAPHRMVINFGEQSEGECRKKWPELLSIVEAKVKPARLENDAQKFPRLVQEWWKFFFFPPAMLDEANRKREFLTHPNLSKHLNFAFIPSEIIVGKPHNVFFEERRAFFATLQSRAHELWARFFSSTLEDRLRYTPSDCFRTFPFPRGFEESPELEMIGDTYHSFRAQLMIDRGEGLTKTYNRFHSQKERASDIERLRALHHEMDVAVLRAYGWDDLAGLAAPQFIEQDADEGKQAKTRLDWPLDFKDEVLSRLIALNAERHAEELRAGLTATVEDDSDLDEVEDE